MQVFAFSKFGFAECKWLDLSRHQIFDECISLLEGAFGNLDKLYETQAKWAKLCFFCPFWRKIAMILLIFSIFVLACLANF